VTTYDPDIPPNPSDWLAADESLRLALVTDYHQSMDLAESRLRLHAAIHVVVENQIALGEQVVIDAMTRLQSEGLSRHDALHAIGMVVSEHLFEILRADPDETLKQTTPYFERLQHLTADAWRKSRH
jgi:hypothetical protein